MKRVNVLWAFPPILPFALLAMVRLLWAMTGLPWEPDAATAGVLVFAVVLAQIISVVATGFLHSNGSGIWWEIKKKEKSDDQQ